MIQYGDKYEAPNGDLVTIVNTDPTYCTIRIKKKYKPPWLMRCRLNELMTFVKCEGVRRID